MRLVSSPNTQSESSLEASSSPNSSQTSSSVQTPNEPDRARWLEAVEAFQVERYQWTQERELLQQNLRELERDQSRNTLRLTSVTHEFERLKKQLNQHSIVASTVTPEAKPSPNVIPKAIQDSTQLTPKKAIVNPKASSSLRTMPPKYTAQEEVNLERLANSLMANMVRLEGHPVRPRDLPNITGERGPWRAVLNHLMTLGKIERRGECIVISMVERIRRGLKPVNDLRLI